MPGKVLLVQTTNAPVLFGDAVETGDPDEVPATDNAHLGLHNRQVHGLGERHCERLVGRYIAKVGNLEFQDVAARRVVRGQEVSIIAQQHRTFVLRTGKGESWPMTRPIPMGIATPRREFGQLVLV